MVTEKALYWMAVGLVALVAGNHFVSRFDGRCLGNRTMAVIERLSGGPAFAAILDNTSSSYARAEARMARARTRMASAQITMTRQDAMCARLQAEKARLTAMQQMQQMRFRMVAPSQSFSVHIPEITVPQVRVSVSDGRL